MKRRQFLRAVGGAVAVSLGSGCVGNGSDPSDYETVGDDESPFDVDPESLLLSMEGLSDHHDQLDPGWVDDRIDESVGIFGDVHEAIRYTPLRRDGDGVEFHWESGTVTSGVWLYETVDAARDEFREHPFWDGYGLEERSVAVESFGGVEAQDDDGVVVFRDANALGVIRYENSHVEAEVKADVAIALAVGKHERWRAD